MRYVEKCKIIASCLSGSVLEWFDFAVYGYLAPIIALKFFPMSNAFTAILLTYSIFAVGFFVRPAGAIFFGHLGDRFGRKTALVSSTMLMAIPTILVGLLPTYSAIGIISPIFLILCRMVQGFALGGEYAGTFIYLVEEGKEGNKGFFSCWADVGCALGMILGSVSVALLYRVFNSEELLSYGWRLPFLSGVLLWLVAWMMRRKLKESVEFQRITVESSPIKSTFQLFPWELIFTCMLLSVGSLGYYLVTVFIPNQIVMLDKFPAHHIYLLNVLTLSAVILGILISARLADFMPLPKIYILGATSCLLLSYPVFYSLVYFPFSIQLSLLCGMGMAIGFCYGPRPLFLAEIFPPALRYSAIAFILSVANAIFGGMGPLVSTWITKKTALIQAPAFLLIFCASMTIIAIYVLSSFIALRRTRPGFI